MKIDPQIKKPQAFVLCPTRELAVQVAEEIRKLAKYMSDIKVLPVYGGQEIVRQIKSLKTGVQIIVGTPGRVMDHMRRKTVKFDNINMVILDEADEMLDMGFREDMETILTETPQDRQTVMFSATMPKAIMDIARNFQKDARVIKVVRKELTVSNIEQFYYEVRPKNKTEVLCRLIDIYNPRLSVVFCNTKRQVDELISELKGRGYFADGIHGDMKQQQRDRVMDDFRSGNVDILIATDVAARGIDVDDVDCDILELKKKSNQLVVLDVQLLSWLARLEAYLNNFLFDYRNKVNHLILNHRILIRWHQCDHMQVHLVYNDGNHS